VVRVEDDALNSLKDGTRKVRNDKQYLYFIDAIARRI